MPDALERVLRRRDRKRRNQRIAAGVVGMAVFVAAVWIVTSGLSLDRSEKSVAPAGEVTGPAETAPPPAPASAAPDVVEQRVCNDGAGARLELTDIGDQIRVRVEVYWSPPRHLWDIRMWWGPAMGSIHRVFAGARVASDGGKFAVVRLAPDSVHPGVELWVGLRARDSATGEACRVLAAIHAQ
jgi:hypothetical protein